jgi:ring-1,2-phenylacetyl-CoA epoxidase subunit PaaE
MTRILDAVLPPETVDEWFLCGPFEMVRSLRLLLVGRGVAKKAIHAEVFHVETTPPVRRTPSSSGTAGATVATGATGTTAQPAGAEVTISLDGRRSAFRLDPDGPPVLEAVLDVRADAPFACRGGVCGTCRAKVLEGSVEMDTNWALEPEEVERGYVLTCQAHPTSPTLVLDYDS